MDDGLELSDGRGEDLGRVRVLSDGDFDDGETERPDICCDRVGSEVVGVLSGESFRLVRKEERKRRKKSANENETRVRNGKEIHEQPCRSRNRCSSWLSTSRAVLILQSRKA